MMKDATRSLTRCSGAAVVAGLLALPVHTPAIAFDPVSYEAEGARIRLSVIGRYWGGWFSKNTPPSPAYDFWTRRLFVGSTDRKRLEILDISNPYNPVLDRWVDLSAWGGEPLRLAQSHGIVAVVVKDETQVDTSILFFNTRGQMIADPLTVPRGRGIAFSPNGKRLVVTSKSDVEDPESKVESAVYVFTRKSYNWWACRTRPSRCKLAWKEASASFSDFNTKRKELIARGVRLPFANGQVSVARDLEPEAIAVSSNSRKAWVTMGPNNAIATVNLKKVKITKIFGLGSKDNSVEGNGLDASDKDDAINIQTWPMRSFYIPDGIRAAGWGRHAILVTANEGDVRSDEKEDARKLELDKEKFPNFAELQLDTHLGRLEISAVDGDTDGDGDLDELFGFGGRSFSTWSTRGRLLFDSGDDFEQITAEALPKFFNAPEDENEFDDRSDKRGPEPESLEIGYLHGRLYAFIALERIGGIMVYDITNPRAPIFQQYINNRNFAIEPEDEVEGCGERDMEVPLNLVTKCPNVGDLEPEGVLYIPWWQSPIWKPLLAVTHEASDSTTLYRIDRVRER